MWRFALKKTHPTPGPFSVYLGLKAQIIYAHFAGVNFVQS
jgi:hypothetical protein